MRLTRYLQDQAALTPGRSPYPIRLTPGQYAELCAEQGAVKSLRTCLGVHPVERIECHTQATGDNVILCPREDLFSEVERDTGVELVSLSNSVTAVPDNIASCEVLSVGELVTNVKPGDIAFIDFYDMKQGYILENDELYIAGSDVFRGLYDVETQSIVPLANYVVTRRVVDRFKIALNGTDRLHVPSYVFTDGIAGGRTSQGDIATHILYEEVVSVGPLTNRPRPGVMTKAEAQLLDAVINCGINQELLDAVIEEREQGRPSDVEPGDLVVFCKELGTPVRVRGEFQHIVPYQNVLAIIDDKTILDNAIRAGRAGVLQVA